MDTLLCAGSFDPSAVILDAHHRAAGLCSNAGCCGDAPTRKTWISGCTASGESCTNGMPRYSRCTQIMAHGGLLITCAHGSRRT